MKQLDNFIQEKLKLNKDINVGIINKVNIYKLKYFTEKDVDKIINWVNNDMPNDIRPVVITNTRKNIYWDEPSLQLFLFYNEDYEECKPFDIPYIRFWYDKEGLTCDIYDDQNTCYHRSKVFKNSKHLDKCFEFIKSKYDVLKKLI